MGNKVGKGKGEMNNIIKVIIGGLVMATVTACSQNAQDRESGSGNIADEFHDATNVVIWRNADQVPNLAMFCADGRAWVATLNSGGEGGTNNSGRGQLLRDEEMDRRCQS